MRDSHTKKTFKDHKMSPTHKFNHKMFDCCQKIQIKQTSTASGKDDTPPKTERAQSVNAVVFLWYRLTCRMYSTTPALPWHAAGSATRRNARITAEETTRQTKTR